jgi:hypothetical protein
MFARLVRRAVVFEGLETTLDPAPYPALDPNPLFGEPIGWVVFTLGLVACAAV